MTQPSSQPGNGCPNGLCVHGEHEATFHSEGFVTFTCDTKACPCKPRMCPDHGVPIMAMGWQVGEMPVYKHADGVTHWGTPPILAAKLIVTKLDEDGAPTGESFTSDANVEVRILRNPDQSGPLMRMVDERVTGMELNRD